MSETTSTPDESFDDVDDTLSFSASAPTGQAAGEDVAAEETAAEDAELDADQLADFREASEPIFEKYEEIWTPEIFEQVQPTD